MRLLKKLHSHVVSLINRLPKPFPDILLYLQIMYWKRLPLNKLVNAVPQDIFLSGRYHFEPFNGVDKLLLPRLYLTLNQWADYERSINNITHDFCRRSLSLKRAQKFSIGTQVLKVGFFCSYANSHFIQQTIYQYAKIYPLISWFICTIEDKNHVSVVEHVSYVNFASIEDAKRASCMFDVVIDADGPLRPTKAFQLTNTIDCLVLNYYNLLASGSSKIYDAVVIPEGANVGPTVCEPNVIELDCLGGWLLKNIAEEHISPKKIYDFAIIAEQFKFGDEFFASFAELSRTNKFVFVGIKYIPYLIERTRFYGWDVSNIYFHKHIPMEELRIFLKNSVYTILDIPNYSSGSGTILGLSVGIPTICKNGKYWINQMASLIMKKAALDRYVYSNVSDIYSILLDHKNSYLAIENEVIKNSYSTGYLDPYKFCQDFYTKVTGLINQLTPDA